MKTEIAVLCGTPEVDDKILRRGAEIIRTGGLVAFPTETVYGLGANALDSDAAAKIYAAKGRPSDNPLIIHVSRPEEAELYAYVPEEYKLLAEKFLPGPLTVIMPKRDSIPSTVTGGLDSVAVRIPSNAAARRLIELSGVPIAAPSANLSGKPSPTLASHVIEDMDGRVDMIIDGGECNIGLESTIIKLAGDGRAELLRPGGITKEQLEEVFAEVKLDKAVTEKLGDGEKPLAPGMKYRHYAPTASLTLVSGESGLFERVIGEKAKVAGLGVIAFDEDVDTLVKLGIRRENILSLGAKSDVNVHAARLFSLLRECDTRKFEKIYARLPERDGLSLAVYNRIIKAAGYDVIRGEKEE